MCQYSAEDGLVNDWHLVHLGRSGARRRGAGDRRGDRRRRRKAASRPGCAGIWNDEQAQAFAPMVAAIKAAGAVPGIQIGHAGRKASANRPWEGDDHIAATTPRLADHRAVGDRVRRDLPSVPRAMTLDDIARVSQDFVDAARRARDVGFEWLELHFAHGYLGQSFFVDPFQPARGRLRRQPREPQPLPARNPGGGARSVARGSAADGAVRRASNSTAATRRPWPNRSSSRAGSRWRAGHAERQHRFPTPTAQIPWGPAFMGPIAERVRREARPARLDRLRHTASRNRPPA